MNLADIGFTKEELQQRVIEHIAAQVMQGTFHDEDGEEFQADSTFARNLQAEVKKQVDATIAAMAEKHVLPNVNAYIENLALQTTNQWGEKAGKPVTFIEYLTQRAEAYMLEMVNYEGKPKGTDGYSWRPEQTRLASMIHKHLHYSIENAMKEALKIATSSISKGIEETVKLKLTEITSKLKTEVKLG